MININKNTALNDLQAMVQQNIYKPLDYMPDSFNKQQEAAIKMFQNRVFLEEIIDETISFNKKLVFENVNKNLYLAITAENLIEVFKLRSDVYTKLGYHKEFPDTIEGLSFDKYDKKSAILLYKNDNEITGTTRLIFDSEDKLPTENKFSFNDIRAKYNKIGELSKLIVKNEKKGLNLEFKNLAMGIYYIFKRNDINLILSGIKTEHFKLYSKFGGFNIEHKLETYGQVNTPFLITSWDPSQVSPFFKKAFLN